MHKAHQAPILIREEGGGGNTTLQCFIYHLPRDVLFCLASRRTWLVVNNHFPVKCSLYESRLLGALDGSRSSFFVLDSPEQLVVQRSCCVIKWLTRKKERR